MIISYEGTMRSGMTLNTVAMYLDYELSDEQRRTRFDGIMGSGMTLYNIPTKEKSANTLAYELLKDKYDLKTNPFEKVIWFDEVQHYKDMNSPNFITRMNAKIKWDLLRGKYVQNSRR